MDVHLPFGPISFIIHVIWWKIVGCHHLDWEILDPSQYDVHEFRACCGSLLRCMETSELARIFHAFQCSAYIFELH